MKKKLFNYLNFFIACILFFGFAACNSSVPRVLVFSKTNGWRHDCIPAGKIALKKLGDLHHFSTTFSEDSTIFNPDSLKKFKAVVFFCTTLNILSDTEQNAFEKYIQSGKGFVGIHSATDTEYDWPWYTKLVGAQFVSHPKGTPTAIVQITDRNFIANKHISNATWQRTDEWYNYKNFNPTVNVIMNLDETSYKGGTMGAQHPIAWYHSYDGGRAFYTGLGHTIASYSDDMFMQHLWGGIKYAMTGETGKKNTP